MKTEKEIKTGNKRKYMENREIGKTEKKRKITGNEKIKQKRT